MLAIALSLEAVISGIAEEKKKEEPKPQPPILAVSLPLGVVPGTTNSVTLRGQNLTNVTAIHFDDAKFESATRIKSRDKAKVPEKADAKKIGDTQIELELCLPADTRPGPISYYVENADGLSATNQLLVVDAAVLVKEKEPNGGFKSAQRIQLPATITGSISDGMDVDVFRIEARGGQRLRAEIFAARHGSALDATLTLYDARGHILATADDTKESRDALLEFMPPSDGFYFLAVTDAHEKAGPTHVYLLVVRQE
ncbi:MAG TPA: PPC domain-containing protein [Verrucomicrobiae bacterium]